jgi:tRNA modification GTPase
LINALVGFERAIVCDQPGTTRDVVTAVTAVEGWPVELSDTAGLRATGDPLEIEGIRRATATCAAADLVLVVDDARNPPPTDSISDGPNVIHVRNKLDLLHAESEPHSTTSNSPIVFTSAVTGAGIDTLVAAIGQQLVDDPPPAGAAVPFTAQQFDALDASRELLMASEHAAARDALLALLA